MPPKPIIELDRVGCKLISQYDMMDKLGINYNVIKLDGKHEACNGKRDFIYEHLLNSNKLE
jgi:hypothetical protein